MTDVEAATERAASLAASAWKQADKDKRRARKNEWITARAFASLTKYGQLRQESANCGIDEDTAGRLAAAYVIFDVLKHYDPSRAWKDRHRLGYSRFLAMGVLWKRYEFDWQEAFDFLETNQNTEAMKAQIENSHNPLPEWHRHALGLYGGVERLTTDLDCPADLLACAKTMKMILNRLRL